MKGSNDADVPSSDDWATAVAAIVMIGEFDDADFRREVEQLARLLEREGLPRIGVRIVWKDAARSRRK